MNIHELKIEGFKSIGELKLIAPNPFSVFVGPNAAGKSNIFQALEFMQLCNIMPASEATKLFDTHEALLSQGNGIVRNDVCFEINLGALFPFLKVEFYFNTHAGDIKIANVRMDDFGKYYYPDEVPSDHFTKNIDFKAFTNFTRLFVREPDANVRLKLQDDSRLASDASNLEKVLKRIFRNEQDKEEITELLQLLIPGFTGIDIKTEEFSGADNLVVYEDTLNKPLTKRLISDGTYNIIAIIAAIFQSDAPQFLCIEEPENGLNPKVVKELVRIFRAKCIAKGHYVWLNTHSQTLVAELTADELILVDKVDGNTQIRQVKGTNLHGLRMDEALLTNALGGGIPW